MMVPFPVTFRCANDRVYCGLRVVLVYLCITSHYPHHADLFEGIEHFNACLVYAIACVSRIKSVHSIISYSLYEAACLNLTILV